METLDDKIKKALIRKIYHIEDDTFNEKIIKKHLSKHERISFPRFGNFIYLISGLSVVFISIGLLLINKNIILRIDSVELNASHIMMLFAISILFLIAKWLEEILIHGTTGYESSRNMH